MANTSRRRAFRWKNITSFSNNIVGACNAPGVTSEGSIVAGGNKGGSDKATQVGSNGGLTLIIPRFVQRT